MAVKNAVVVPVNRRRKPQVSALFSFPRRGSITMANVYRSSTPEPECPTVRHSSDDRDGSTHPRQPQPPTALPSFAAIAQHARRPTEAPTSKYPASPLRPACSTCSQISPLVREVAAVAAELDEHVQASIHKSASRVRDSAWAHSMIVAVTDRITAP